MPHRQVGSADARGALLAGLAVFAAVHAARACQTPDSSRSSTRWVYDGLMVLAVRHRRIARVSRRPRACRLDRASPSRSAPGRSARSGIAVFEPETYPSMADVGLHRLLPAPVRRASCCCSARASASIAGTLWLDGLTAALAAAALGAAVLVEVVLDARRARPRPVVDEPRLPARRRPPALRGRSASSRSTRWRPGPPLAPPRARRARDGARGRDLPLPVADGTYVEGDVDRHPLAGRAAAHRVLRLDARPHERERLEVEGRPLLAVPAVCALVATGILVYDHFTGSTCSRSSSRRATLVLVVVRLARHVPREPPPLRADPPGGDDRRADRPRQPPQAPHRPRAPARRRDGRSRRSS